MKIQFFLGILSMALICLTFLIGGVMRVTWLLCDLVEKPREHGGVRGCGGLHDHLRNERRVGAIANLSP